MPIGYYLDPLFFEHDPGYGHPERIARLRAVEAALADDGFAASELLRLDAPPAPREALTLVHSRDYLEEIEALCMRGGGSLDPDTTVNDASYDAATKAAGAGLDAVARIRAGEMTSAFVAARPPGHHARPHTAMGFCIVNNIAVVAAALASASERVAVVDWDAHHGNGTQEVFWRDPRVFYVSLHQYPFYPFSGGPREVGEGPGAGYTLNLPMPPGAGSDDFIYAFDVAVLPALRDFRPDWILVSAGFDAHYRDPLTDLAVGSSAYRRMAADLRDVGVPVVGFLEGGYDLDALGESVRQTLEAWAGEETGALAEGGGVHARVRAGVEAALAARKAAL